MAAKGRESGQGDPQKLDSLALRRVQDQSLRFPFVLAQIGLGPASISHERRDVLVGLVSSILLVREEAHRPCLSPARPALFQGCLKREQQLSRLDRCINLISSGNDEDSLVAVINPNDLGEIVTLTIFLRRRLRGHTRREQKRQCKNGPKLSARSQDFHPDDLFRKREAA